MVGGKAGVIGMVLWCGKLGVVLVVDWEGRCGVELVVPWCKVLNGWCLLGLCLIDWLGLLAYAYEYWLGSNWVEEAIG